MRRLRGRLRLSQPEVARRGGLSLQAVWCVENGQVAKPQAATLAGLAEALETTVEILLGEEPEAPASDNGSAADRGSVAEPTTSGASAPVSASSDQVRSASQPSDPEAPADESRPGAVAPTPSAGTPPPA